MTSLADKSLLSGGDNKPPMLEKHLYDSWKSIMELYMMNRPHGRMILASVEKGPLVWPSITEDGVTRLKEYVELTPAEAIQADCDIKAINIILQGLPTEIYALVSQHRVAKDLWEKIKLLMQGTSLTKQERECKLYDEFDKFTYKKGETLHEYYLRFTLLLNDMNIYKMPLEQFQVNTKFLNTLPDEWSKFVTDVKLVKDLHTTNVDQLHAHLQQHERHAIEVRMMHERNPDPLALVASHQLTQPAYQSHLHPHQHTRIHHSLYSHPVSPYLSSQGGQLLYTDWNTTRKLNLVQVSNTGETTDCYLLQLQRGGSFALSSALAQAENGYETWFTIKTVHHPQCYLSSQMIWMPMTLICDETQFCQDCSHGQSIIGDWLSALTEDKLSRFLNSYAHADVLILSMFDQNISYLSDSFSGSNAVCRVVLLKQNLVEQVQEKDCLMKTVSELKNKLKLEENRNIKREIDLEKKIKQLDNIIFKRGQSAQTVHMLTKSKICYDHSSKQAIGFEKPFYMKKARESKPKLYDGDTVEY
ncbi:hypothetical protein Tco_0982477 [Tanacetum coccineum]